MFNINSLDRSTFEELCCQLAYEEFSRLWKFTRIDGSGWDWWVECYITLASWEERWLQAKFFTDRLKNPQRKQIEDSFNSSIKNHPNLKKWILCLPIDLTDDIIKGKEKAKWERSWFENFRGKNEGIIIEERFLLDINRLLIKYQNIDNAFFNPDPVKRKESLITLINNDSNSKIKAEQKAKEQDNNIEKIFINGEKNDIERSKNKYFQYNVSKFRLVDYLELRDDIEKIEKSINIENFDSYRYSNFCADFQRTISNYFYTYRIPIAELSPAYNYVFSDIWKQIWGVLSIGVDWRFTFHYENNIYQMIISKNE